MLLMALHALIFVSVCVGAGAHSIFAPHIRCTRIKPSSHEYSKFEGGGGGGANSCEDEPSTRSVSHTHTRYFTACPSIISTHAP